MLRHGPDGHISSAAAQSQLDPTGPPSCLAPAKVSIPSSFALPSFPCIMTYLTIINPESNGDAPGERLMAPSARYTCSAARLPATKLWPNRRPRSPVSKINTASSPVALGAARRRAHHAARGGEKGAVLRSLFVPISHTVPFFF